MLQEAGKEGEREQGSQPKMVDGAPDVVAVILRTHEMHRCRTTENDT